LVQEVLPGFRGGSNGVDPATLSLGRIAAGLIAKFLDKGKAADAGWAALGRLVGAIQRHFREHGSDEDRTSAPLPEPHLVNSSLDVTDLPTYCSPSLRGVIIPTFGSIQPHPHRGKMPGTGIIPGST